MWSFICECIQEKNYMPAKCVWFNFFTKITSKKTYANTHWWKPIFVWSVWSYIFLKFRFKKMWTHTGEKPYSYEVFGSAFSDRPSFKRHMPTHWWETVFMCSSPFSYSLKFKKKRDTTLMWNHICVKCIFHHFHRDHI